MRMTSKGQVTIPLPIRMKLGLLAWTEVEFEVEGNAVRVMKKRGSPGRGQRLLEVMRRAPRPTPGMTTNELMALTRGD